MPDLLSTLINAAGLTITATGAFLLFYGMPSQILTGGQAHLTDNDLDPAELAVEKRTHWLGTLGLGLFIFGTLLQITAASISILSDQTPWPEQCSHG